MVPPSSDNGVQPFSHLDWMLLERIARHMLLHAAVDALSQLVQNLLQISGSCSSCRALQQSLPTCQRAGQQKAALFVSNLHFREVFLSEHFYISERFLCSNPPSDMVPSTQAGSLGRFWKAQPATCEPCWPASLPTSVDPVQVVMR